MYSPRIASNASPRPMTLRSVSGTSSNSGSFSIPPPLPTTAIGGAGGSPRLGTPTGGLRPAGDDLESLGYLYSLRVAILQAHLLNPPTPRLTPSSPTNGLPSPPLTAPSSRLTFFKGSSPTPPADPHSQPPSSPRRKSSFGLSLRGSKSTSDDVKLPKEFLSDFWLALAGEEGEGGWKAGVQNFLGMIKKGSKTDAGMNLREIQSLLEVFTSSLPPAGPHTAAPHVHHAHFLQFLYHSLPRLSHFNPNARPQSEKDKDLLFRLRAEVSSYLNHDAMPSPTMSTSHRASSASGSALGLARSRSRDSRKDGYSGGGLMPDTGGDELILAVGDIWRVPREALERDISNIRNQPLEHLYLADLKKSLAAISLSTNSGPSQKARHRQLSQNLSSLLRDFPELATPSSPADFMRHSISVNGSDEGSFFTPPRKNAVFSKLMARVQRGRGRDKEEEVLERCREIWGIGERGDDGVLAELEALVHNWGDNVGSQGEMKATAALIEVIRDLPSPPASSSSGSDDVPTLSPPLQHLLSNLLALLSVSASSIFPSHTPPPPSLVPLLCLPALRASPQVRSKCSEISDELKGAAVGEYVTYVDQITGGRGLDAGLKSGGGLVDVFENVGEWIEEEIREIKRCWAGGIEGLFNPAGVVLSKQLPLFLAELHALDKPRAGSTNSMFTIYEITGRLLELWEELCPGLEHGFELDAFFEPHVLAWLNDTEGNQTQEWVSRAVGMDSWVPEGANHHSQSVIDLFDFIRGSAKVILHDLPLGEYKRAVYLIDLSKTVSVAVTQYASTVHALFTADMTPVKPSTPTLELQNRLGGKASNWLAKGQQAVKSLDKRKAGEGFVIPPAACVKLTDMGAAQISLDDLVYAMEAEETSRIVKPKAVPKPRYIFTVTVQRGEAMYGKSKPADGFVAVVDRDTGERMLKSRTVLGVEDPRWEETIEVALTQNKILEVSAYDRSLVGKHDLIGSAQLTLSPKHYSDSPTRDVTLPLTPRGTLHLRITMEGGERHDVTYHLSTARRALERTERDMIREVCEKIAEYAKVVLGREGMAALAKKGKGRVDERDVEASLASLLEYLNENFSTFSVTLTPATRLRLMLQLWHTLLLILLSLLLPPLSPRPLTRSESSMFPPSPPEIEIIFKYLHLLKAFFNAREGEVEHGIPAKELTSGVWKEVIMVGQYLDLPTPALRDRAQGAVKAVTQRGSGGGLSSQLGRMGMEEDGGERLAEVLLRIARTRSELNDFVAQQIGIMTKAKVERHAGMY